MGKTVTTYLIDGDPKGTQYVFISNKICQMYVISRACILLFGKNPQKFFPRSRLVSSAMKVLTRKLAQR